ncbi:hypothetical protein K7I13_05540 [Brucepastera parasyntrophica]|uniref:hypothetical protein n=1 Tax=Brucepastera parasyntrophica TaxID=2880008 RepID=UPI00210E0C2A|nr:hypothetical protein [Brucepastera parasyntrophica]ULQ60734.1 hypothetical protein K7I13_05540 [Brucepastera parasyntrophica]
MADLYQPAGGIKKTDIKEEIRRRYGIVRRASGYHLYTAKGRRLLDMWQERGSAILGWRSGRAKLVFKNILDRGITGTFPSETEGELIGAVRNLLPHYSTVRWYATKERARIACAAYLDLWSDIPLIEHPLLHPEASRNFGDSGEDLLSAAKNLHGVPLWRPWLDDAYYNMSDRVNDSFLRNVNAALKAMVLVSPFPFAGGCTIAVFAGGEPVNVPPSDSIAPALLGAYARAFRDLAKALFERSESDWAQFDSFIAPYWDRRGPYLIPKIAKDRYADFFSSCLDEGILISPNHRIPSVVPFEADTGNFKPFTLSGLQQFLE